MEFNEYLIAFIISLFATVVGVEITMIIEKDKENKKRIKKFLDFIKFSKDTTIFEEIRDNAKAIADGNEYNKTELHSAKMLLDIMISAELIPNEYIFRISQELNNEQNQIDVVSSSTESEKIRLDISIYKLLYDLEFLYDLLDKYNNNEEGDDKLIKMLAEAIYEKAKAIILTIRYKPVEER